MSQTIRQKRADLVNPSREDYRVSFLIPSNYKALLEEFFKRRGWVFSSGLRTVIYDYMRSNGVGIIDE
jgi:phage-related protein